MNNTDTDIIYKAMLKSELAISAGVSNRTLAKWCRDCEQELEAYGYHPSDKLLSPGAVKFLSEKYVITI